MKKAVTITFFIFWAVVTAILTAGLIFYSNKQCPTVASDNSALKSISFDAGGKITLNQTEVTKHHSAADCWLIINNKVYNVTTVISSHPGGVGPILSFCGQDGTQAFATKDLQPARNHSDFAQNLLNNYYLGNLNQTLTKEQLNSNQNNINNNSQNATNALRGRGESEGD